MNDVTNEANRRKESLDFFSFSLGTILVGVVLILSSLLPFGGLATHFQWTENDAEDFAVISEEYHRSALQSPERAGLTEEQMDARRAKLKNSFVAMRKKLEHARQQPRQWSRYLLWSGALLAALGGLGHLIGHSRQG